MGPNSQEGNKIKCCWIIQFISMLGNLILRAEHRCARGTYGLLMRRLKPRIYTPPRREKNTPPPQINLHPPRNSRIFFGFFFTNFMSAVFISQNLTGTSHFLRKSSPAAGNIAFLIRTMHFHTCIWIPSQLSLLLSHSISFASLAALGWGHQSAFCLTWPKM